MQRRFELLVENQKLVGDLFLPDSFEKPFPVMICSHGFATNRKRGKWPKIAERFPQKGIAVINFDHRGAIDGESDGEFEDTTLTKRVEDLRAAIDYLAEIKEIDSQRIGLLGSSLGGLTILALPKDERIKAIVLLATPIVFPRLRFKARESLEKLGYYQYPDGSKIKREFYEDLEKYNFQEEAKKIDCPLLIIHGYLDELVCRHQARVLYEVAGSQTKELKFIEGGDHAFTDLDKLNEVLVLSLDWFKKYLK